MKKVFVNILTFKLSFMIGLIGNYVLTNYCVTLIHQSRFEEKIEIRNTSKIDKPNLREKLNPNVVKPTTVTVIVSGKFTGCVLYGEEIKDEKYK